VTDCAEDREDLVGAPGLETADSEVKVVQVRDLEFLVFEADSSRDEGRFPGQALVHRAVVKAVDKNENEVTGAFPVIFLWECWFDWRYR